METAFENGIPARRRNPNSRTVSYAGEFIYRAKSPALTGLTYASSRIDPRI